MREQYTQHDILWAGSSAGNTKALIEATYGGVGVGQPNLRPLDIKESNLAIRKFLVALWFLNAKSSLFFWSKWQIDQRKWFLNTNLFLIKLFLIAKFDCARTWSTVWIVSCYSFLAHLRWYLSPILCGHILFPILNEACHPFFHHSKASLYVLEKCSLDQSILDRGQCYLRWCNFAKNSTQRGQYYVIIGPKVAA